MEPKEYSGYKTIRIADTYHDSDDATDARDKFLHAIRDMYAGECKWGEIRDCGFECIITIAWVNWMPVGVVIESCDQMNNFVVTGTSFFIEGWDDGLSPN